MTKQNFIIIQTSFLICASIISINVLNIFYMPTIANCLMEKRVPLNWIFELHLYCVWFFASILYDNVNSNRDYPFSIQENIFSEKCFDNCSVECISGIGSLPYHGSFCCSA